MSQHDYDVANAAGSAFRSDINSALAAIVSQNSGATAPAATFAYQFWADTTAGILKQRNAANSAWINILTLSTGMPSLAAAAGTNADITSLTALAAGAAATPSITPTGDANTGMWFPAADTLAWSTGGTERLRIDSSGNITQGSVAGVGYGTGAGGAVTQATSRTTGVTLNKPTGAITMFSAAGSASWSSFVVTNSLVAATDTVLLSVKSSTNLYQVFPYNLLGGSFALAFVSVFGTATDAPVINFSVIKGVAS